MSVDETWKHRARHTQEKPPHVLARRRRPMTGAEAILWSHLRRKGLGYKFRRQHQVGPFVAGFVCLSACVIVEVREASLNTTDEDGLREEYFRGGGWRVVLLSHSDIYRDLNGVLGRIVALLPSRLSAEP